MSGPSDHPSAISVVLADDHSVMRRGLRLLLDAEDGLEVVAEAGTVQAMLATIRSHRPSVLLLDLSMPGGSSIEAIARVSKISPQTAVVILTMEHEQAFVQAAYDAGAVGYVLKEAAPDELVRAVLRAAGRLARRGT